MRLSLNEVQTVCLRAAVGAGLPFGLAEDCAAATAWLSAAGLNSVEVFRRALDGFVAGRTVAVRPETADLDHRLVPATSGCQASALFAGAALCDRIVLRIADSNKVPPTLADVDEPLLAVACTAIRPSTRTSLTISWHRHDSQQRFEARCDGGSWSLWGDQAACLEQSGAADMATSLGAPGDEVGLHSLLSAASIREASWCCYEQGITVNDGSYHRINAHARMMLVADSQHSRVAGAGAGLSDND